MSSRRGGPRRPRPGRPRDGLHPAAVAATVAVVAAVALGVGWAVGSAGPGVRPGPQPAGTAAAPRADGAVEGLAPGTRLPTLAGDESVGATADLGARVFRERCARCHTIGGGDTEAGPDLALAALSHDPAWVRAMVASPDSMFRADSAARQILRVHGVEAEDASTADPEVRALVAFLRSYDPGR